MSEIKKKLEIKGLYALTNAVAELRDAVLSLPLPERQGDRIEEAFDNVVEVIENLEVQEDVRG